MTKALTLVAAIAAMVCIHANAATFPCHHAVTGGGVGLNTHQIVGNAAWPHTLLDPAGAAAFWYCKDAQGVVTAWQIHVMPQGFDAYWRDKLNFYKADAITTLRKADCIGQALPSDEAALCAKINAEIIKRWPK